MSGYKYPTISTRKPLFPNIPGRSAKAPLKVAQWAGPKLGRGILVTNLLAKRTCPGMGSGCAGCYAFKDEQTYPNTAPPYRKATTTLAMAAPSDYFAMLGEQIARSSKGVRIVRIHGSGDFFSPEYVDAWRAFVRQHPKVLFYGYTRSWTIKPIRKALQRFRKERNVHLYASVDPEREALSRKLVPSWPKARIIEPRNEVNLQVKRGGIVCPAVLTKDAVTCEDCSWCMSRGDVFFPYHP